LEADPTTTITTTARDVWEDGEDPAASQGQPILRVEGIDTSYGKVQILHGVSMVVHPGEAVSIIGPNGAGKSTVLKSVVGQLKPSAGSITFNGTNVMGMRPEQVVRHGMAVVPQGRIVFGQMTVVENLEMGAYSLKDKSRVPVLMERIFDLFPRLAERKRQEAGTMSGGEQQMLAMGRALMSDPKMVLMDEPSLGLAPMFVELIFEQIGVLKREGLTLLLVEQNAVKSLSISDRAYVLELGRNRFTGSGDALLADPRVRRLYLGG
jgi:branched-chain amino acid transport system ATP-binding protein